MVQQILASAFGTGPDGLPGNDDLGAVSGWYVGVRWACIRRSPASRGWRSAARSSQIDVRLGNGRTWRIRAEGAPASNYVQSLSINGRAHDVPWVAYDDIANGATLHFAMGSTPSQWGSRKQPPSFGVPVAVNAVDSYNNRGFSADGATNADAGARTSTAACSATR